MQDEKELANAYYSKITLVIDQTVNKPFIYEVKAYNAYNTEVYNLSLGEVDFSKIPDDQKFVLPKGVRIIQCENRDDVVNTIFDTYSSIWKNPAGEARKSIVAFFKLAGRKCGEILHAMVEFMLKYGHYCCIGLAIAAITGIVIVKRHGRK